MNHHQPLVVLLACLTAGAASAGPPAAAVDARANIIPWPKNVELDPGQLRLTSARIVAGAPALLPLAKLLSEEIAAATRLKLPAVSGQGESAAVARVRHDDNPDKAYRGLMIDVARQYHMIDNLKQIVEMCRLYKVRYLQLHLTDDQGFMFPTKAFPKVFTQIQNGGQPYTLEYNTPVTIEQPGLVRAALFDSAGKQVGPLSEDHFRKTGK
ncbi:MAG: family 20 glycosylhydrolase [Verrucomicrobia bacterium]|nr:family 20 glycosylhydrolase [Verrucomicrobiota bacterium]